MKIHIIITDDDGKIYDGTLELQKTKNQKISIKNESETSSSNNSLSINIPESLIEPLMELKENLQIPILWSFSSQSVMTMEDFINACSEKGFMISPSWLPSAGGYFKSQLIKKGKFFTETKSKINGKKTWKLTDVGKIKLNKIISELSKTR